METLESAGKIQHTPPFLSALLGFLFFFFFKKKEVCAVGFLGAGLPLSPFPTSLILRSE